MVDTTSRNNDATPKNSGLTRSTSGHHRTVRNSVLRRILVSRSPSVRFSTPECDSICLLLAYFPAKSFLPLVLMIELTYIKSMH